MHQVHAGMAEVPASGAACCMQHEAAARGHMQCVHCVHASIIMHARCTAGAPPFCAAPCQRCPPPAQTRPPSQGPPPASPPPAAACGLHAGWSFRHDAESAVHTHTVHGTRVECVRVRRRLAALTFMQRVEGAGQEDLVRARRVHDHLAAAVFYAAHLRRWAWGQRGIQGNAGRSRIAKLAHPF